MGPRGLLGRHARDRAAHRAEDLPTVVAPFILVVDVEPAPRHRLSGDPAEWQGFERCVEHLAPWRARVLERTGRPLRITWFMRCDPQISAYGSEDWGLLHFAGLLDDLRAQGDELGLHVHPYHATADGGWAQDWTDERALCDMIASGVQRYERAVGRARYFRMGDGWLSEALVTQLEVLEVEYDLTIEPGRAPVPHAPPDTGARVDYRRAPRLPYRPSRGDFLTPDETDGRALRVVPLTMGCFDHPALLHPASEGHRMEMLHLSYDPAFVRPFVDFTLTSGTPTVAVTRTGDLAWSRHLLDNFDYLLGHPDLERVAIEPPAAAVERHAMLTAARTPRHGIVTPTSPHVL